MCTSLWSFKHINLLGESTLKNQPCVSIKSSYALNSWSKVLLSFKSTQHKTQCIALPFGQHVCTCKRMKKSICCFSSGHSFWLGRCSCSSTLLMWMQYYQTIRPAGWPFSIDFSDTNTRAVYKFTMQSKCPMPIQERKNTFKCKALPPAETLMVSVSCANVTLRQECILQLQPSAK